MIDNPSLQALGAVRELRPTEDLSLMHGYELRAAFEIATVSSLKLVPTDAIDDSFRLVAAPLAAEPGLATVREPFAPALPAAPNGKDGPSAEPAEAHPASALAPSSEPQATASETAVSDVPDPRKDAVTAPAALAYGFDPSRVRILVDGLMDVRAASAAVLVPRAACDLVDVPSRNAESERRLRSVLPTERVLG